ncbi:hypothetical protein KEM54_000216 [Ascosphaera aggregata]|nr:hypothetical protein KEM54_000216 [Ascosphaera aggregata]
MDPDASAEYPLHEAAREGQTSIVKNLLKTNPKLAFEKDADERYPIHWAVANKHVEIVEMFMKQKGFDPDVQDSSGWTPLMMAASLPNGDGDSIVEMLLSCGADVNIKTNMGQNALHFATSKQNISTIKMLLNSKCSARVKDKRGQLALHRAAASGSLPIVKLLLTQGKSPLNATDNDGMTALHHAIAEGNGDCAVMLLKEGAETDKENVDGELAINLAPDQKVKDFIVQSAKREGIEL